MVRAIESAFKIIDKRGNDIETTFNETNTPYSILMEECPFFTNLDFVSRIRLSTKVWVYLLEQIAVDITNQIEADYTYEVITSNVHADRAVGMLTDNLTNDFIGFIDFDHLIQCSIIEHAYDISGIKQYLIEKGVIAPHHTIYSNQTLE